MVVSSALDHFTSRSTGMPLRKRAQQRTGGISGRGKGLLPTPLLDVLLSSAAAMAGGFLLLLSSW
jgi:hypothetical protein